jgi:hypothetical protein
VRVRVSESERERKRKKEKERKYVYVCVRVKSTKFTSFSISTKRDSSSISSFSRMVSNKLINKAQHQPNLQKCKRGLERKRQSY